MSILIKKAKIIQAKSELNNSIKDILIKNGIITKIANNIQHEKAQIIQSDNLHVSIGWMDIGTESGEPGFEHRETFESLSNAAVSGGYTALAIFPNTFPVVDNKSSIQYIINSTESHTVSYYPIAAISKNCEGKEITEMIDMERSGACAFSDGPHTIVSSGLFLRALEYSKVVDGLIIHHPTDPGISNGNDVHEGTVSTSLGLKACPSLSETMTLERDIQLAEYADARLLVHNLSSGESVEKLKALKSKKLYASVPYLNLCKTEEAIQEFDVNSKVSPPLRSLKDKEELTKGVNQGLIDIICSNHLPLEEELKKKEFVYANSGAIGLQTCFSALNSFSSGISIGKMVNCLAHNPRKMLKLEVPLIAEGHQADLCIFDPELEWELNERTNCSKSKNSPFWNQSLKGKVLGVVKGKKSYFNNY
jgi:dihydroorotase